jgi:hypothetical protein
MACRSMAYQNRSRLAETRATHHYWSNVHTLKGIGSGLLATVAWPLIFRGVNLHIH